MLGRDAATDWILDEFSVDWVGQAVAVKTTEECNKHVQAAREKDGRLGFTSYEVGCRRLASVVYAVSPLRDHIQGLFPPLSVDVYW